MYGEPFVEQAYSFYASRPEPDGWLYERLEDGTKEDFENAYNIAVPTDHGALMGSDLDVIPIVSSSGGGQA